jgi:hypothetical protein
MKQIVGVLLLGWMFGCAHGTQGVEETSRKENQERLEVFVPLSVGNSWTYGTTFQEIAQPDMTVAIVKEENGFYIDNQRSPSRLRYDGEGLRDGSVRYLLKSPLKEGEKWMSVADVRTVERYEIIAANREMRVPAGVFRGCVTVRMEVRLDDKRSMINEMSFAPNVGIIEIRTQLKDGAKNIQQSLLVLKSYQLNTNRKEG